MIYAPYPAYPSAARRARLSGSGLFQMVVGKSGEVTEVRVTKSTGSKILDSAAVQALRKWRFRSESGITRANQPIHFDL
ncbi:hypothetical protein BH20VER1_BH20VER1_04440 [soil metagenome]